MARVFGVMRPFQPAPPAGVGSPFAWGDEDHVRELLDRDFDLEFASGDSVLEMGSGEAVWDLFVHEYGPTKMLHEGFERQEELHRNFVELHDESRSDGSLHFSRRYLLTGGTRR